MVIAVVLAIVSCQLRGMSVAALGMVLLVAAPLAMPVLLKKRMGRSAAAQKRELPNISYKFTVHNCVLCRDTEGGDREGSWL